MKSGLISLIYFIGVIPDLNFPLNIYGFSIQCLILKISIYVKTWEFFLVNLGVSTSEKSFTLNEWQN